MQTDDKIVVVNADDIKTIIHAERKRQKLSQERISEKADLPDMHQTYQRFMHSHRGSWYTAFRLLSALGYEIQIKRQEVQSEQKQGV